MAPRYRKPLSRAGIAYRKKVGIPLDAPSHSAYRNRLPVIRIDELRTLGWTYRRIAEELGMKKDAVNQAHARYKRREFRNAYGRCMPTIEPIASLARRSVALRAALVEFYGLSPRFLHPRMSGSREWCDAKETYAWRCAACGKSGEVFNLSVAGFDVVDEIKQAHGTRDCGNWQEVRFRRTYSKENCDGRFRNSDDEGPVRVQVRQ